MAGRAIFRLDHLALIAALTILSGCAFSGRPAWLADVPPQLGYVSVVGMATAQPSRQEACQAAVAAAVAELTSRFGFTAQLSYREVNESRCGIEERRVEERLETSGPRVRLEAPVVAGHYEERTEGGLWAGWVLVRYEMAAIEREKARLAAREEEQRGAAAFALGRARSALESGAVGSALGLLQEAQGESAGSLIRCQAEAEFGRVAGALVLEALPPSTGERLASLAGLGEPLAVKATFEGRAAAGLAVRFQFTTGGGELIDDRAWTGPDGVARCRVGRLEAAPGYLVSARIADLPPRGASCSANKAQVEFAFRLRSIPWRINLDIAEDNLGVAQPQSVVAAAVARELNAAGAAVAVAREASEVEVRGRATTRLGSDNLGWEHAAVADVRLEAVRLRDGRVLAEKTVTMADFSDSVEQAGLNALGGAGRSAARAVLEGLLAAAP
ncbi:MAG: hypothetical protein V2A77_01490 [Pseudomonadota bacterium]